MKMCVSVCLCVPKDTVIVVLSLCCVAAVLRNASVSPHRLFNIRAGCQNYPPSHCKCVFVCLLVFSHVDCTCASVLYTLQQETLKGQDSKIYIQCFHTHVHTHLY